MEWADLKANRQVAIDRMIAYVDQIQVEPGSKFSVGLAVTLAGVTTAIWQVGRIVLSCFSTWGHLLVSICVVPFIYAYYAIDIAILSAWHSWNVYRKMTGG